MLVHFRRQAVHVDDLLVLRRVPEVWVVLDHVVADTDDHVGSIESAGDIVVRLEADGSKTQRV